MQYAVADIHGRYDKYAELLRRGLCGVPFILLIYLNLPGIVRTHRHPPK